MKNQLKLCAVSISAVLLMAACQNVKTTESGAVGIERQQRVSPLVDRKALTQEAYSQYKAVLKEADQKHTLNANVQLTERVRKIGARIIPQVRVFRQDAANWQWEINVLNSKELNAWCMPGGKIAFYSGLIEQLKLNDDEIAAIMGHEIAHALREHAWERASEATNASLGLSVIGIALGANQAQMNLGQMVYNVTFMLPNSREHETEADRMGVELAARGGYNPRAAVSLWQKMAQHAKGAPPKFLSTHPSTDDRLRDLEAYSQKVMPLYEGAKRS